MKRGIFKVVLFVIFISLFFSCGHKKPTQPSSSPNAVFPDPTPKEITIYVDLPTSWTNIKFLNMFSNVEVQSHNSATVKIGNGDNYQIAFITDLSNNTELPVGIRMDIDTVINAKTVAIGILLLDPYVMFIPNPLRTTAIENIIANAQFQGLIDSIQNVLDNIPNSSITPDTHPNIFKMAHSIIKSTYQSESYRIGNESDPHLDDGVGTELILRNPKMIAYGVEIRGTKNFDFVISGKSGLLCSQIGWPPLFPCPPVEKNIDIGNGNFNVAFYKGWPNEYSFWPPKFMGGSIKCDVTWVNMISGIGYILEIICGLKLIGDWMLDVNNGYYNKYLILFEDVYPCVQSIFETPININSPYALLRIIKLLIFDCPEALRDICLVFNKGAAALLMINLMEQVERLTVILEASEALNTMAPFFYDWAFAPDKSYCINQNSGNLSECIGTTIESWLSDAKIIMETTIPGAVVNVSNIASQYGGTVQGNWCYWDKNLADYEDLSRCDVVITHIPTDVTLRFVANNLGEFYVGVMGEEDKCLSSLVFYDLEGAIMSFYSWLGPREVLTPEPPIVHPWVSCNYGSTFLASIMHREWLSLQENGLASSGFPIDNKDRYSPDPPCGERVVVGFERLTFRIKNNYSNPIFIVASKIHQTQSNTYLGIPSPWCTIHNGTVATGWPDWPIFEELNRKWCPMPTDLTDGNMNRSFRLSASGLMFSWCEAQAVNDNGNSSYIRFDGSEYISRSGYCCRAVNRGSFGVSIPSQIELGGYISWSGISPEVTFVLVAEDVSVSNVSESPGGMDGNPSPVILRLEPGWNP